MYDDDDENNVIDKILSQLVKEDQKKKYKRISEETYDKLCALLTDFENDNADEDDENYMSDGEWLDCFYDMCAEIQKEAGG